MPKFQVKSSEQFNIVELEQSGDDVIVRVDGVGMVVLRYVPYAVEVAENVANQLGMTIVHTGGTRAS